MTDIVPASTTGPLETAAIWLKVNGQVRQTSNIDQLIWKIPEIISYLSAIFELKAGDLIMTGTPAGVAAVERGDLMEGHVEGVGTLRTRVV